MNEKVKLAALVIVIGAAVSGCASGGLIYPSTSGIDRVSSGTLTPSEQKAVIKDLQTETSASPTPN